MSTPLKVAPGERDRVRVFALSDQLGGDIAQSGTLDNLRRALGLEYLHDDDVQVVQTAAISHMGLPAFLSEAYDIDPAEIAPHAQALNALSGEIAVLRSGSFGGGEVQLKTGGAATLIAAFAEPATDWSARPLQTASANPRRSPRAARDAARRVGFGLFAGMMLLIFMVVFWMFT